MAPKRTRRGKATNTDLPPASAKVQSAAPAEEVPSKKSKKVEVEAVDVNTNEKIEVAQPKVEEKASASPTKEAQNVSDWFRIQNLLNSKDGKRFFSYMHEEKSTDNAGNPQAVLTIAISSFVWSQTVSPSLVKKARQDLSNAVKEHFSVENLSDCTAHNFNCGPSVTGLLEKYFTNKKSDNYAFLTLKGDNNVFNVQLQVNDEVVEEKTINGDPTKIALAQNDLALRFGV